MVRGQSFGLMVPNMLVLINTRKNMVKMVILYGQISLNTGEVFTIIIFRALVSIHGMMVASMKVIGRAIKWMGKESLHGMMEENISVSMLMIKSRGRDNSYGLMGDNIKEAGIMVSNMELEYILLKKE